MDSNLIADVVFTGVFILFLATGGIYSIFMTKAEPERSDSIFSLNGLQRNSSNDSFDKLSYDPDYPSARWTGQGTKRKRKNKRKGKSIKSKRG
jgi:hypothetical protein